MAKPDLKLTSKEKRRGWHEARFEFYPTKVEVACAECGRAMWLPKSKVGEYLRCGAECNEKHRQRVKEERARRCLACGETFIPRPWLLRQGQGLYCSQRCNLPAQAAITAPETLEKAQAGRRAAFARGDIAMPRGAASPFWKGGHEAYLRRRVESGKSAAETRAYRANNPHKVREFAARRAGRKLGRLPRGTIPTIGLAQRWKCAICRQSIRGGYHVDHVQPLALGGEHAPRNIQLLCQPCNLRKNAKDPIAHMRALGRLL